MGNFSIFFFRSEIQAHERNSGIFSAGQLRPQLPGIVTKLSRRSIQQGTLTEGEEGSVQLTSSLR
jgi:hypothetical protein